MKKTFLITILVIICSFVFCGCGIEAYSSIVGNANENSEDDNIQDEIVEEEKQEYLSFKVMSFNIRCYNNGDSRQDKWINRKPYVIQRIKNANPDTLGMQEVTTTQLTYFIDQLGYNYDYVGLGRDGGTNGEGSYIFYKKDKFELLETKTIWLSETPDEVSIGWDAACRRVLTYATLKDKETGVTIRHYNTHLDHKGSVAVSESIKIIKSKIESCEYPCMITGDFNLSEGGTYYKRIVEFLDDSKYLAEKTMQGLTYNGYKDSIDGKPIDFCFVSKGDFIVDEYKIDNQKIDGWFVSDHYPIIISIRIPI